MLSYFNGKYLPKEQIAISPDDRGFLFADGLYEVLRTYDGEIFQVQAHIERLNYGAREISFHTTDFSYLIEVASQLVDRNGLQNGDALVYIQVTRGAAPRFHRFPPAETHLTVYATARPFEPKKEEQENGISIILVPDQRRVRCDIKQVGLLPNVLAHQKAVENGAAEAVFIRNGKITEGTHSNIFAIFDGIVTTPPRTIDILGGITRKVVLEICANQMISFKEREILQSEMDRAEELMITGTTVEITPVVKMDGLKVGSGVPGPLTRKLQEAFYQFRRGF